MELADAFYEFAKGYYRKKDGTPSGWLDHIHLILNTHLCGLYGRTPAADFGPKRLVAVRQKIVDAGAHAPTSTSWWRLSRVASSGARPKNWCLPASITLCGRSRGYGKGRTTAREPSPVKPVEDSVVEATLPHLSRVLADMVRFQRLTGCRPGEVCQLRPGDVDRSGDVWEFRPGSHKTEHHDRERIIYIGPKAQEVILPYLLRSADAYCFSPAESEEARHVEQREARQSKVQPSQRNRRKLHRRRPPCDHYTKDSYGRAIQRAIVKGNKTIAKAAAEAGTEPQLIAHWHANQLRHTKATEIRRQFGLEAAQVILGHAKADVTQVYAERDSALASSVMQKIG